VRDRERDQLHSVAQSTTASLWVTSRWILAEYNPLPESAQSSLKIARLNAVYANQQSRLDPDVRKAQRRTARRGEW